MTLRIVDHEVWSTRPRRAATGPDHNLSDLRAVVLLAGAVRPGKMLKQSGRSVLDLPVGANRLVMDCWREQWLTFAETLGIDLLSVRVLTSKGSCLEPKVERYGRVEIRIEQESKSVRGTAGLMSDVARDYDDSDQILVSHAGQLLFEPLTRLARGLGAARADVAVAVEQQGLPSGMMLVRCGALRGVCPVGYVDFNEQALPELAKDHRVRVARFESATSMSVRTLAGYIGALRAYHRRAGGGVDAGGAFDEDWRPTFGIAEPGSSVAQGAVLHDAVALRGSRVEAGAVLVRSVVCAGAVVPAGAHVVDEVVGSERPGVS